MLSDQNTNHLYLSGLLPQFYPDFFKRFKSVLSALNIPIELLPNTKDIWAVDYMPIQADNDRFIRFVYDPDYLKETKYAKTRTDSRLVCDAINLKYQDSKIILDGGNVVKSANKVIMCDKIFNENPHIPMKKLIGQLIEIFEIDQLVFIPWEGEKYDYTGHSDGMVRFINEDTVLVNVYSNVDLNHHKAVRAALHNGGLDWVDMPCNPSTNKDSAEGFYINYLEMQQGIIMPTFNSDFDDNALKVIEEVFKGRQITTLDSNEIAKQGGILNCISWNIEL
jgi:agmatine deiminase